MFILLQSLASPKAKARLIRGMDSELFMKPLGGCSFPRCHSAATHRCTINAKLACKLHAAETQVLAILRVRNGSGFVFARALEDIIKVSAATPCPAPAHIAQIAQNASASGKEESERSERSEQTSAESEWSPYTFKIRVPLGGTSLVVRACQLGYFKRDATKGWCAHIVTQDATALVPLVDVLNVNGDESSFSVPAPAVAPALARTAAPAVDGGGSVYDSVYGSASYGRQDAASARRYVYDLLYTLDRVFPRLHLP